MSTYHGLRTCKHPECAEEFEPYRSWQEFHSPACRNSFYDKYVRFAHRLMEKELEEEKGGEEEKLSGHENGKPEKSR